MWLMWISSPSTWKNKDLSTTLVCNPPQSNNNNYKQAAAPVHQLPFQAKYFAHSTMTASTPRTVARTIRASIRQNACMDRRSRKIHAITISSATLAVVLVTSAPTSSTAIRRAARTLNAMRVVAAPMATALTMSFVLATKLSQILATRTRNA